MAFAHKETLNLKLFDEDDYELGSITLKCLIVFTPGEPESGRFGPVENYDPGSGDEFSMDRVTRVLPEGAERDATAEEIAWAEAWMSNHEDYIAEQVDDCVEGRP